MKIPFQPIRSSTCSVACRIQSSNKTFVFCQLCNQRFFCHGVGIFKCSYKGLGQRLCRHGEHLMAFTFNIIHMFSVQGLDHLDMSAAGFLQRRFSRQALSRFSTFRIASPVSRKATVETRVLGSLLWVGLRGTIRGFHVASITFHFLQLRSCLLHSQERLSCSLN